MSVTATIALLQTKHRAISGVVLAPTTYPDSINAAQCPCVIMYPGPAVWRHNTIGEQAEQSRTYLVRVFVKPFNMGQGVNEALALVNTLLQAFGAMYFDADNQQLAASAPQVMLQAYEERISDGGYNPDEPLVYMGELFHGFEFQIGIQEVG